MCIDKGLDIICVGGSDGTLGILSDDDRFLQEQETGQAADRKRRSHGAVQELFGQFGLLVCLLGVNVAVSH